MFKSMRRKKQLLPIEDSKNILKRGKTGVLALYDDNGYPYTVPLNYFYDVENNKIYFHCAKSGHKIDAIKNCNKVSFCVIDKDEVVPEKYTTKYCSVIIFGLIEVIENEKLRLESIEKLALKYNPNDDKGRLEEIDKFMKETCILSLSIEHITGKIGLELLEEKDN